MPRTVPPEITPNQEQRRYFQLFKITLSDGTILRYTDADLDLTVDMGDGEGAESWDAGPGIERTEIRAGIDLQIDTCEVTVPNRQLTLGTTTKPVAHWARVRRFHNAEVALYIYDDDSGKSMHHSTWTVQGVSKATIDSVTFLLESILARLDLQIPRTIFQPQCNNALYDGICGVIKSSFKQTGSVSAATIDTVTMVAFATPPTDSYFDLGQIEFTSGILDGQKFTIATHVGNVLSFYAPLPDIPAASDAFDIYPGCHKTIEDCRDKFGNTRAEFLDWRKHFRGFPYIPSSEESMI